MTSDRLITSRRFPRSPTRLRPFGQPVITSSLANFGVSRRKSKDSLGGYVSTNMARVSDSATVKYFKSPKSGFKSTTGRNPIQRLARVIIGPLFKINWFSVWDSPKWSNWLGGPQKSPAVGRVGGWGGGIGSG